MTFAGPSLKGRGSRGVVPRGEPRPRDAGLCLVRRQLHLRHAALEVEVGEAGPAMHCVAVVVVVVIQHEPPAALFVHGVGVVEQAWRRLPLPFGRPSPRGRHVWTGPSMSTQTQGCVGRCGGGSTPPQLVPRNITLPREIYSASKVERKKSTKKLIWLGNGKWWWRVGGTRMRVQKGGHNGSPSPCRTSSRSPSGRCPTASFGCGGLS